jgi:hypothetical protein
MTDLFTVHSNLLWDVAGVDGLQVMKTLVGQQIDRIAPFQSLETELDHIPCSILRLCEGNFRLRWAGHPDHAKSILNSVATQQRVWVKQFPWLSSIQLSDAMTVSRLANVAIAKPPFSLTSLALNCAAPARINSISVLVWRHTIDHIETLELHTAAHHIQHLQVLKSSN